MRRRVVVTGMGLRSPIGNDLEAFSQGLQAGRRGVRRMPEWETITNLRTGVAGVVELGEHDVLPRKVSRGMGRVGLLAALAARDAVADAGLKPGDLADDRCGVSFGSTAGSSDAMERFLRQVFEQQSLLGMQSSTYLQFMSHTCAANLAVMFGTRGPLIASCTACTSGSQGVGFAVEAIQAGKAERMLAGGAEEMHFMDAGIFDIMRATSTHYNDRPEATPRPFDAERDGLVVGEGAGALVLEDYDSASRRGARIWGEVLGYGTNCNGTHLTNSCADGIAGAIERALADAGLSAGDIEHINAHATATETGDRAEAEATNRLLGQRVPVSAIKGGMGHTLGASGALESIATLLMMNEGYMAASLNLDHPDPQCAPLGHVLGEARAERFSIGMNNNFAFGGVNTSLIFGRV
jgi:3-oxoacyl-[acyl-carrier-protein] synthase II